MDFLFVLFFWEVSMKEQTLFFTYFSPSNKTTKETTLKVIFIASVFFFFFLLQSSGNVRGVISDLQVKRRRGHTCMCSWFLVRREKSFRVLAWVLTSYEWFCSRRAWLQTGLFRIKKLLAFSDIASIFFCLLTSLSDLFLKIWPWMIYLSLLSYLRAGSQVSDGGTCWSLLYRD